MEIEEATAIISNTIRDLRNRQPKGTGIRARGVKGLVVEKSRFSGLDTALDVSESQDIAWKSNIVDNYDKYSELPNLLEQFLAEATKKEAQVSKGALARIRNNVLRRWPELAATLLLTAIEYISQSLKS
ncbi:hypothetical protein ES703_113377 [subsurface metagenome]